MTKSLYLKTLILLTISSAVVGFAGEASALNITRLSNTTNFGAEIPAYDPLSKRLFVTTPNNSLDVLDISDPANPQVLAPIPLSGGVNSVAVKNGIVAVALQANTITDPGTVAFFNTAGTLLSQVQVGALPDMLTFTPDGTKVVVANEGEASNGVNPDGSVSIINVADILTPTVSTASFTGFNGQEAALRNQGVRIFPNVSVSQDVEPEYITISEDSSRAWVALQENNALALVDLLTAQVTDILPLGTKDLNASGNGFDPSDRDGGVNINNWPVLGMYMPDTIASFTTSGQTYLVSANEGDARDEEQRVSNLTLDPNVFTDATLQDDDKLGRLGVSDIDGLNANNEYSALYTYGSRSFSIWNVTTGVSQVFDSGDDFEQITASLPVYNSNGEPTTIDTRSDNKGPEPEGLALGVIGNRRYSFTGLERTGGFMVYDITDPLAPQFTNYINDWPEGDRSPEGLLFIPAADSPNGLPLVVVANEVSQSLVIYSATVPEPGAIFGLISVILAGFGLKKRLCNQPE